MESADNTIKHRVHKTVLIGYGQIAQTQHAPILLNRPDQYSLSAIVDPLVSEKQQLPAPLYKTLSEAIASVANLDTVVLACPPHVAGDYAQEALEAGLHVLMEKPPGLHHQRLNTLEALATKQGVTLFTGYHSAYCPRTKAAKQWITEFGPPKEIRIIWKESAAKWHPGQLWIMKHFGVLDILFNPLSMLEVLLEDSDDMTLFKSTLVIPSNWESPISGTSILKCGAIPIYADYAWNHEADDIWTIQITGAKKGDSMELFNGGARMRVNGIELTEQTVPSDDILRPEYEALYDHFHWLMSQGKRDIRPTSLRLLNEIQEKSDIQIGLEYHI